MLTLGGEAVAGAESMRNVVEQIGVLSELGIRVLLVHGGGPQTAALAERLLVEVCTDEGAGTRVVRDHADLTPGEQAP